MTSLALSLVKRVADTMLGIPGLLTWHSLEAHRLLGSRKEATGYGMDSLPEEACTGT